MEICFTAVRQETPENGLSGQPKFFVSMLLYLNDMKQRYLFRMTFAMNITLFSFNKEDQTQNTQVQRIELFGWVPAESFRRKLLPSAVL